MAWSADVHRTVLPNGLTVLVQPVAGCPAAAIVTRVRAGFFDEPDHWTGISHVLEHMFFKGTPTRGVGEIARATKAAGGYLNAATSYDYTTYYAVLPSRGLPAGLAIQADALRHATIDAGELGREIQVIIEEAKRKEDTPSAVAQETLHALLFDVHRIRRWRIGTAPVLRQFTREDVFGYYRSRYVPERTIVAVAGGVDAAAALALVEQHYGDWPAGSASLDASPAEPARRERRVATLRGDVRQSDLIVGWRGVPALHPDELALDVAAAVLSAGRAGWLYRALRETGIAASVGAYNYSPTEVGVFALSADLDPARVEQALAAMAGEIHRLREAGPSAEDLERVRSLLRARWARRFETVEGRAAELAAAEALGGVHLLEEDYQRLLALDAEAVRQAARRHLDPSALSAVVYHPRDAGTDLTVGQLDVFDAPVVSARSPGRMPALRRAAPRPVRPSQALAVTHVVLPGVDLLVRRRVGVPTVTVGVYRQRHGQETAGEAGLGALAIRSAVRGAGNLEGPALAGSMERLGGGVAPAITADWYGYQGSVLAEHLSEAAALLDLVMHAPTLADEAIAIERALLADDARQLTDDMFRYPVQLAFRAAYGPAGYGLPVLGHPETVSALTAAQVRAWHAHTTGSGRVTVVAVGDLDPLEASAALAGYFGDRRPAETAAHGGGAISWQPLTLPHQVVESRDKAQTALAMLFPGPTRHDPDRHAAEVWAAIAGGLGGRLFEALRDRRSLAYTVAASPWQRHGAGGLLTYIATSPAREVEAREAMLEELARFRAAPPTQGEVERAVNYLTGQLEVSRQSAGALVSEILDAWYQGSGLEELNDVLAPYRAVTADVVHAMAARCLEVGHRVEGVVRGTAGHGA